MARFGFSLIALILITGLLLSLGFKTPADRQALIFSGVLVVAVQMATFGLLIVAGSRNRMIAWGMGAVLRATFLVLYGVFLAEMLGLPLTAALVSFAVFMFLSMLLETTLISYAR